MADFGGSADQAVRQTADAAKGAQDSISKFRKDPEGELGMSREELLRRQKEANTPLKVTTPTGKQLDVKSSARAQQIMNKGVDKYQREKRKREIDGKIAIVKKARWVVIGAAIGIIGYIVSEFMYPIYLMRQARTYKLQVREERAKAKMEETKVSGTGKNEAFSKLP